MDSWFDEKQIKTLPNLESSCRKQLFSDMLNVSSEKFVFLYRKICDIDDLINDEKFIRDIEDELIDSVKILLKDEHLNIQLFYVVFEAVSRLGHTIIFKLLLEDPRDVMISQLNSTFIYACGFGYIEIVKLLLENPKIDSSIYLSQAFVIACMRNQTEVVKLLLEDEKIDPSARNNQPIICACKFGYIEIIKLLLNNPKVDPTCRNNETIRFACKFENLEVAELLLQDSRITSVENLDEIIADIRSDEHKKTIESLVSNDEELRLYKKINKSVKFDNFINKFLFKRYLEPKVGDKMASFIVNHIKEILPHAVIKDKKSRDERFEEYYKDFNNKIIFIQKAYRRNYGCSNKLNLN